ncbi:MAG: hypothetical protein LBD32_00885 [Cytophagales bacterium]|jgi:hypothetical protein|nr:hypothetical protein [Cytophagales bacterium]
MQNEIEILQENNQSFEEKIDELLEERNMQRKIMEEKDGEIRNLEIEKEKNKRKINKKKRNKPALDIQKEERKLEQQNEIERKVRRNRRVIPREKTENAKELKGNLKGKKK